MSESVAHPAAPRVAVDAAAGDGAAHLQGEWARLLLASFADAGVREVVISPGSRSTPFVLAASRHPELRCRHFIDERAAAFFALGQARATGRPSLLVCTSGTAAANYLPAVVEAGVAHVPLLVLSADRPVELAACGANQTIDQLKLFGDHARRFFDLGAPDAAPRALRALRRTAAQAVFATLHPEPGAVHLNARARKPLEPRPAATASERRLRARVDQLLARPIVRPVRPLMTPDAAAVAALADACRQHERGLIVCGPAPLAQASLRPLLARLGELTGFPIYCEPASQGRFRGVQAGNDDGNGACFVDAFDALLHSARLRARLRPQLILQLGACPTSGAWERYLGEHAGRCEHWVVAPWGWHDAQSSATHLVVADLEPTLKLLTEQMRTRPGRTEDSPWTASLRHAEATAWQAIDDELKGEALTEGAVAQSVAAALPPGGLLALGNSLPIREADTYCRGDGADLRVWSQRGASGIDGVVSGAAGAASVGETPAALLIGDVSFLHDLAGLAAVRQLTTPFAVVVVQNRGGRIFEQLPLAADPTASGEVLDHWLTPHDLSFAHAAALYHLPYERVARRSELEEALARALARRGGTVIEAEVPVHGAAEENRRVWRRIDEALHDE